MVILVVPPASYSTGPDGTKIEWAWTDWLGMSLLLLVIVFATIVVGAYVKGVSPLQLLDRTAKLIRAVIRK